MSILLKRGTKAAIDDQASKGLLQKGEPLFIEDESRFAVATSPSTYQGMVKQGEMPYVAGQFTDRTTVTSNYYPTLTNIYFNNNITVNTNLARLTVSTAGIYMVHYQQLVSTVGYICYFYIRKNGTVIAQAYSNGDDTYDIVSTTLVSLQAGDYIDFYYSGTTSYAWGGPHSHFFMHRLS